MEERLTEELLDELLSSPNAAAYLDEHHPAGRNLAQYLQQLLNESALERKDVVRAAQLDSTYGYQLFTGRRTNPSRDKVLQIAFAMHLSLRETDRLLQVAGCSKLYCKDRRDSIVIFHLDRQASLSEVNDALYQLGECVLGDEHRG